MLARQNYQQTAPVQRLGWGDAAKQYFAINPKSKFFLMALATKITTTLVRLFPALASFVIVADDAILFLADDPLLGITGPMLVLQLFWYAIRITGIHYKANHPRR
jgi:hypothetical protein